MKAYAAVPNVEIRRAALEDVELIAAVLREAFAEFESLYTPAAFAATTPTAWQIRDRWNEGPVWAAVRNGTIIGMIGAVPKDLGLYVRSMAVHSFARRHGIAGGLLREVEAFTIHHHHKRLFLSTTSFLEDAIHLYERFGFQRNADGPQDLFVTPLFTMVKGLELANGESGAQIKEKAE